MRFLSDNSETGCKNLLVDKTFFEKYLDCGQIKQLDRIWFGFHQTATQQDTAYLVKHSPLTITIGDQQVCFNEYKVVDLKKKHLHGDLMFPIPIQDSLRIWELNMEEHYIKIHPSTDLIPQSYTSIKLYTDYNKLQNDLLFDLPFSYCYSSQQSMKDTLFCLFDTGYPLDIYLCNTQSVIDKIARMPLSNGISGGNYVKTYRTIATFFDFLQTDTVSIRFKEHQQHIPPYDIVGLNFLVRFNYYIDLKNKLLYVMVVNHPNHFYSKDGYDIGGGYGRYTFDENLVVDSIGKLYANDAFAKAGGKDGDTIIWYCGYSIKEQTDKLMDFRDVLHQYPCYHFKVIRNGDTLNLKTNKGY